MSAREIFSRPLCDALGAIRARRAFIKRFASSAFCTVENRYSVLRALARPGICGPGVAADTFFYGILSSLPILIGDDEFCDDADGE